MSVFIKFELMGKRVIIAEIMAPLSSLMCMAAPVIPYRTLPADGDAAHHPYTPKEDTVIGWGAIYHSERCSEEDAKKWSMEQREARPFQPTVEWCRAAGWPEEMLAVLPTVLASWPKAVEATAGRVARVCRRVTLGFSLESELRDIGNEIPF